VVGAGDHHRPPLLLLDEPTRSLDDDAVELLWRHSTVAGGRRC